MELIINFTVLRSKEHKLDDSKFKEPTSAPKNLYTLLSNTVLVSKRKKVVLVSHLLQFLALSFESRMSFG